MMSRWKQNQRVEITNPVTAAVLHTDQWRCPLFSTLSRNSRVNARLLWSGRHLLLHSDRWQFLLCCIQLRFKKALCLKRKSKSSLYALQLILVIVTHAHAQARLWWLTQTYRRYEAITITPWSVLQPRSLSYNSSIGCSIVMISEILSVSWNAYSHIFWLYGIPPW